MIAGLVLAVGAAILTIIPLIALLMRDRPADVGLQPYGGTSGSGAGPARPDNPVANALRALAQGTRSGDFWLLFFSFFICGASTNGLIGTHLIPACVDHGKCGGGETRFGRTPLHGASY